jgi:hypothetical protein
MQLLVPFRIFLRGGCSGPPAEPGEDMADERRTDISLKRASTRYITSLLALYRRCLRFSRCPTDKSETRNSLILGRAQG